MKGIHKVAVLGAGTMGARIAAHFANAGVPSYLLDIVPPGAGGRARNQIAAAGLEAARKAKPAAFMDSSLARLVRIGNFEDDLDKLAEVDWVLEAVVEDLNIKRALLKKVEAVRKPGSLVTTNTSGLPVGKIAEGFSPEFQRFWFGTHFFNPPRYMRLLELIPTPHTEPAALARVAEFADVHLGKGGVVAKDTPNFIANRIGTFCVLNVMRLMQEMDLTIEEVDALTGEAVGWPRSATFRTLDLVGLDVLGHVVNNFSENVRDERSDLALPSFVRQMLERKWLGDKTQGGFYKKAAKPGASPEGGKEEERWALDWKTLDYHPRGKVKFPALEMAKNLEDAAARLRLLLALDSPPQKADKAAQFLWRALADLWTYSANRIPEISDSILEIDRAMRLGLNWELGPFELWDAAGVEATVRRIEAEGHPLSAQVEQLLASGQTSWYADDPQTASGRAYFDLASRKRRPAPVPLGVWSVAAAKKSKGVVSKNPGASLVDLGDGVAAIEFHSKMNALGGDIVQLILQSLKSGGPGDAFDAFVITNDAANFSVGANLMLLLMSIQEEEWDEVDLAIRQFQNMTQAIKFSAKPVVVAPFGMTLGGGAEIVLHASAVQAHAELYIGLVEVGVGLLPAGGGSKEMLLRALTSAQAIRPGGRGESVELMEAMKKNFETVATAKVAASAQEARGLAFLRDSDAITANRQRVLSDAKARALELARAGYQPPQARSEIPAPGENILAALKLGVYLMRQGGYITDYEVKIGNQVAEVLCGGNVSPGTLVTEQYILDLEREAFKSLCGEKKTQERMQYTLKTGKPLRN
ncbi:MAG TPA: 3-hydroxyacyl-CoA dehydrogenase NAD-binding domain-containing protein [Terriglobales bacterium]|nr:3-hydroxyacyl-CoA dehydrogenase NAD-binding domain-containing protein [Terriglobales bacterium]